MENSNLDYKVVGEPVFDQNNIMIPNRKLLRREDNGHILSIVSAKYQIIQNSDLMPNIPANFEMIKATTDNGGRKCRGIFIDKANTFEIEGKQLNPMIIFTNSFDGSTPWDFVGGLHRLICTNGMYAKGIDFVKTQSRRHIGDHVGILEIDFTKIPEIIEKFKRAASVQVTYSQAQDMLKKMIEEDKISERRANQVIDLFQYKSDIKSETVWGFYNAVTDLASNYAKSINQQDQLNLVADTVLQLAA